MTSPPLRIGYGLLLAWGTTALGLLMAVDVIAVVGPLVLAVVPQAAPFETEWFGPDPPLAQVGLAATALLLLPVLARLLAVLLGARPRVAGEVAEQALDEQRRRIERDLHDGAQLRLTAVAMALGVARVEDDARAVRAQVDRAYEQARLALAELRELLHGLHPAEGLGPALAALAERSPVPLEVEVDLPTRHPRRSRPRHGSSRPRPWPTSPSTAEPAGRGCAAPRRRPSCTWRWATTGAAAPIRGRAQACAA